jgi:hypothetical protein
VRKAVAPKSMRITADSKTRSSALCEGH